MPSQEALTVLPPQVEAVPLVVLTGILPSYKNQLLISWGNLASGGYGDWSVFECVCVLRAKNSPSRTPFGVFVSINATLFILNLCHTGHFV